MDILAVQQRFIDAGYQWEECIFNDGLYNNCSIHFSLSKDPLYFTRNILGDFGWGRFDRRDCWQMAAEWLDKVECGECKPPMPREE